MNPLNETNIWPHLAAVIQAFFAYFSRRMGLGKHLSSKPGGRLQQAYLRFSLFNVFNTLGNLLFARS